MRGKLHIVFKIVVLLYAVAVGVLCFAKFDPEFIQEQSQLLHLTDKDVHFLMFLPFVPLIYLAFASQEWGMRKTLMFSARMVVVAVAVASMIELIQGQTGYRGEDLWDALAGIGGAATGAVILLTVKWLAGKRVAGKKDGRGAYRDKTDGSKLQTDDDKTKTDDNKTKSTFCKGLIAITLATSLQLFSAPQSQAQSKLEFKDCCHTLTVRLQ